MTTTHLRYASRVAGGALLLALLTPLGVTTPAAHAATCNAPIPNTAVLTIDESEPITPGEQLHLSGSGFTPGQRLAVKMDHDNYGQIGADPAESVAEATRSRIEVEADGTFTSEPVLVPRHRLDGKVTEAGDHTLNLLDSGPVTTVCAVFPTAATYTTALSTPESTAPGDVITVSGTGWLDRAGTGSSSIGVVIEEAGTASIVASQRVAGHRPHANERIWAVVPAQAFTEPGTFSVEVTLPDGTTSGAGGSTVAFGGKDYRVRLWSGAQLAESTDITRNVILDQDFTVSTAPTQPPAQVQPIKVRKKPVITGKAKVGKRLKVTKGKWKPRKVTLKFQWVRNGKAIKGATKAKYKVRKADRTKKLRVKVTAKKPGWKKTRVKTKAVKIKKK